jgi:hypothetical protein
MFKDTAHYQVCAKQRDERYAVALEFTGHASGKPQYVTRFCGEFVGQDADLAGARLTAVLHDGTRLNLL